MTVRVQCTDCDQELHRVGRGAQPPFEARVPCRDTQCSRRPAATQAPAEQLILSSMDRDALRHLREVRRAA